MTEHFAGLHVVVTGGTGALGRAVVDQLLDQGAHCYIPVFDEAELEDFPYRDHPRLEELTGVDLTSERSARRFYSDCPPLWASIHLAGGYSGGRLADTTAEQFVRLMNLNALTCLLSCREAAARIRVAGEGGRLVNVSAKAAVMPTGGVVAYAAAKAAVAAITTALAAELAPEGIWVNAVLPSIMDTPDNRAAMPDADFDRWPKTHDVAATIVHLASPANAVARGALVPVYGRS